MSENEKDEKPKGVSRREFLKDAGLVVGGATIGSMAILSACKGETTTQTVTNTKTVTSPGGTTTVTSPGGTATVTSPPVTTTVSVSKFICPLDNQEFATLDAFKAHLAAAHPGASLPGLVQFLVNGDSFWRTVEPNWTLAYVLREKLGFTGTKRGCDSGACGVCTVIMAGRPVLSCLVLALEAAGKAINTIEGLAQTDKLDPLQQAFIDNDALQCGFCTSGQIMTAKALLAFKPKPTVDEIKEFMAGALCRCGSHGNILAAIQSVGK
jgi:xanthine dehydrogenase YagT iron-sulfur-binding subunit